MQNGNNGRHALQASVNSQSNDDEFYLDPKDIYEQREKLAAKEAIEGTVSRKPGAHSSAGSGNGSRTTTSHSSSKRTAAHSASPSKNTSNTNSIQLSEDDDDEFTGYVNPQEIQDQREKLAAKDGRQPPSSGNVREVRVRAVPSSSSSHHTTNTAATKSSSHSEGSKKSKSKQKHKHKSRMRHRGGGSSDDHPEHAGDQTTVEASPVVPVENNNDDPVLIATATKIESGLRNPSKCWLIFCVLVILAIGGGIGAAVVLLGKPNGKAPADESPSIPQTNAPTTSPVASTPSPTGPRPSNQDCKLIADGDDVANQAELTLQRFQITVEVIFTQYPVPGLGVVSGWIHSTVLPVLANCEIATQQSRALRSSFDRMLQTDKPLVGDAKLDELFLYNDLCEVDLDTCVKFRLFIDLFLSGDNWNVLELQTLIDSTLKAQAEAEEDIQKIQNVNFLEEDSLDPPVPSTSRPTASPIQTSPTPTTGQPITQPTSFPIQSSPTPTTKAPVSQPTVEPLVDCFDVLPPYFHSGEWRDEFLIGDGEFPEFDCGTELPIIFLDVGPAGDCSGEPVCVDFIPSEDIEERCRTGDQFWLEMTDSAQVDWSNRHIVFGFEHGDNENPCNGEQKDLFWFLTEEDNWI